MSNGTSFIKSIHIFDELAKNKTATDDVREYAESMRDFFLKMETLNFETMRRIDSITGKSSRLN